MTDQPNQEKDVLDPTFEWDMKLTRTEWTLYWKKRYEDSILRIQEARDIIKQQTIALQKLRGQNHAQNLILSKFPQSDVEKAKDEVKKEIDEAKEKSNENG